MATQRSIIKSVIDRVLWTRGATQDNRRLLAEAIDEQLVAEQGPSQYKALFAAASKACVAVGLPKPSTHTEALAALASIAKKA